MTSIDSILAGKYPAKDHARRVVAYLRQNGFEGDGVIYLEAQKSRLIEDNDSEEPFRSVSLGVCFLFAVMSLR
jgi:Xaa-Pro dipeptidase